MYKHCLCVALLPGSVKILICLCINSILIDRVSMTQFNLKMNGSHRNLHSLSSDFALYLEDYLMYKRPIFR